MKNTIKKLSLSMALLLIVIESCQGQSIKSNPNQEHVKIPLEQFVGYYQVGVKPNKPFFRSRWYIRAGKLFSIYDSDRDREMVPYENGKLNSNIFLSEQDVHIDDQDSYYLVLNFDKEQLQSFKVIRPRSEWATDLYGYRIKSFDKLAIDTEEALDYQYQSANFSFSYSSLDSAQIRGLSSFLESKYKQLLTAFNIDKLPPVNIRIYPDFDTYHNAVLTPNAPKWQSGRAWDNDEIRMVSPIIAQKETGEQVELNEVVLHEFIHCIHLNMVRDGTRVPGWLWEGIAMYKGCCQWTESPKELTYIKNKKYPSIKQIENDKTFQKKYDLGYYLIAYLDQQYGWETVLQLIQHNGKINEVLYIKVKEFERNFYDFLEEAY